MFHNIFMIIRKDIIKSPVIVKPKIKSPKIKKLDKQDNNDLDFLLLLN